MLTRDGFRWQVSVSQHVKVGLRGSARNGAGYRTRAIWAERDMTGIVHPGESQQDEIVVRRETGKAPACTKATMAKADQRAIRAAVSGK